jgi:hypothetical protein
MHGLASGAEWPVAQQNRLQEATTNLLRADVSELCEPGSSGNRDVLDGLLAAAAAALPEFSDAITHTYFSLAELGRTN